MMNFFIFINYLVASTTPSTAKDHNYDIFWEGKAFVEMINSLKTFYNATSIFIVLDDPQEVRTSSNFTLPSIGAIRSLSSARIFSQIISAGLLYSSYETTLRGYPRQIFILPIVDGQDVAAFARFTRRHELRYHVWLLIFLTADDDESLGIFCSDRKQATANDPNYVRLRFNTRLLVKCHADPRLREWYRVNERVGLRANDLMEWTAREGLQLATDKNLFERRNSAAGTALRVSFVNEGSSAAEDDRDADDRDREPADLFSELMIELGRHINFELVYDSADTFGSYNRSSKSWNGLLGDLQSRRIDVAAAEMTMSKQRLEAFDFAIPLIVADATLFIREPSGNGVQWNAYLKAFSQNIWISIVILILSSAALLTYMKSKATADRHLGTNGDLLVENHLFVWGIYCQQGLAEFPSSSSLRMAYVSIFFSAVVVSALYSACIISFLTVSVADLPFDSLPKCAKDATYRLIVIRDSAEYEMFANAQDHVLVRMFALMKRKSDLPRNELEAFRQVCREQRVVLYTNEAIRKKMSDRIPCKLVGIKTERVENIAFALTKNNPFTEFINYHILRFRDSGILQRMKQKYFREYAEPPSTGYDAVSFGGVAPLITILAIGIALSLLLLVLENTCHKFPLSRARARAKKLYTT
ncbi:hypothetical protein TKK_0011239 [Trichogramma kaykai]|uniref:Ionotropic glutamate receptor C-terminal domain-containing protein n=1 Tax=Trichogramma kaykai TaxID=54128 RepID=A0ABD2WSZ3_9HYME